MDENFEQYVRRILGYLGEKDPLPILEVTPSSLAGIVTGLDEARLRRRPAPSKWSMAEIIIHLAEVEVVVGYRVRVMLGSNGSAIQAFDQDQWVRRYDRMPIAAALGMHRGLREANLALYRSLTIEEWNQYGIHSERGRETVDHTVKLAAGHDLNHLKQLEALSG